MEAVYSLLTERALEVHSRLKETTSENARAVIAFAGPPGSGKTTIASRVAERINAKLSRPAVKVLPMDGFHLTRAQLSAMPDPVQAHARRGAHWTFDAEGVIDLVKKLHSSRLTRQDAILAPTFDHAVKDPVDDGLTLTPDTEIVIMEGNWLLLDKDPWRQISGLVDDTWFVDVDRDAARKRVALRHVQAGIDSTMEAAYARVDGNDTLNGDEIRQCLIKPNVAVRSVDEELPDVA